MKLLVPDPDPPTLRDRTTALMVGIGLMAAVLFLLWYAPQAAADPEWQTSTRRLRYMDAWPPFWHGPSYAIIGSCLAPLAMVAFWKAIRPYTPERSRSN